VGAIVGIGVVAGKGCQVGALSLVPKHTTLEAGAVYAASPVCRLGLSEGGKNHRPPRAEDVAG
jgi:carbonic anhydrase/acetyltransferase-like protein (isoleucine patch superfamily)